MIDEVKTLAKTKAVIVAGGRGTRLGKLTAKIPKPMLDLEGKPVLERIMDHFSFYGIREFILCLCHLPEQFHAYFGNGSKFGWSIEYVHESPDDPRGSAGAVRLTRHLLDDSFIVTYADILRELDLTSFYNFHRSKHGVATIQLHQSFNQLPRSLIQTDEVSSRIISFMEHPRPDELPAQPYWSNGSLYIFEKEIFSHIPPDRSLDFGKDIFPALLNHGQPIYAFRQPGYFVDMGTPENLIQVSHDIKSGKFRPYDNHASSI